MEVTQSYDVKNLSLNADGTPREAATEYLVTGADDGEDQALRAVLLNAPPNIGTLQLLSAEISEKINESTFKVAVAYEGQPEAEEQETTVGFGPGESSDPNVAAQDARDDAAAPTISFSMGSGTRHVTIAHSRRVIYGSTSQFDPGYKIGWNGRFDQECEFAGVDVPAPSIQVTYGKVMRYGRITTAFIKRCARVFGKVNAYSFKGWEPGELLFAGLSFDGERKSSARITVNYNFMVRLNEDNCYIAGNNVGKLFGWEVACPTIPDGRTIQNIIAFRPTAWVSFSSLNI